ncbi:translocation/assembly module TamB domain-containing protein [Mucilaginibacter sp. dw_454]|uniref:translocation/assembly module TamB domain-containing protein n=1 Tax=Mucilaginibacter sp. dw_454 TaxID=2720079 RepID=UPI001BD30E1D|nr:translocation/assembly module TamB domain-containing protein [Mucilaginibacter sp. dw_454]
MFLLLLASVLVLLFQYKPVQTWAAKKATAYLSKKLGTEVNIKSLYIKPFTAVVLEDFYVLDKSRDTLVRTPKLTVDLNGFSLFHSISDRKLDFSLIQLDNGSAYLKNQIDGNTNLQFILDHLKSKDTTKTAPGKPWTMIFEKTVVNNFHFRYKDLRKHEIVNGINFDDLDVRNFSVTVNNMDLKNHLFMGDVRRLTLREKGGFYLKNFTALTTVDSNRILAKHLFLQTPHSLIRNYLNMSFKSFKDFSDFTSKVDMDGHFSESHISSTDIAYFTSGLEKISFELGVNGRIQGIVNNLKANNLTITAGQATFIKGDFSLKGLPDWDHTYLDLKFDQLATNKKDLDFLYGHFTGAPKAAAPALLGKFGNINFTGKFKGLQSNFAVAGTFKTQLGRFDPDIKLKMNKAGTPSYGGTISAYNFNLAGLLDDNTFGRTTFKANINGSGDALKNLNANISANVNYFDLKGYNYQNIAVNGNFAGKKITAKLSINDKNIKFDGNGSVDLNPTLPVYSVVANVHDANLHQLKLLGDTITISAQLNTTFSGSNLKNFEGKVLLSPIRIIDPRNNYLLDSVYFSASGKGDSRIIALRSDALDGSIKGSYDLATLPSYFKTIAKKYIPSLQTDIVTPKPQNFELSVQIKNLDPLTAIFLPDLKIPDQGNFIGKFNSADKTATINGYIKTIDYKKILFHDFILDESTSDDNLSLNVSLKRIDLSKDLFIKNIDITNFVNNDSLKFNVKLADKDATNQLDLYGLVEFGRDTTAKLKLLPSDVIIEHQTWRLQEQVRIRLLDGKTQISGFELSNGDQVARINGFISDNAADQLKVSFSKFSMSTLNELTKSAAIQLHGTMDGDVVLSSILKSPGVDAHLNIDTFKMNNTLVGNIKVVSNLDNERSRANVNVNILNRGLETLNIGGAYYLGKGTEDKLDFDVKMTQTEAIIFEPFVKDLVSDLKGTVSTNLKLTGSLSKPQLNGDLALDNTGVTVNYLQTPYTVSTKLNVENSVININNMVLKDSRGGTGTANGKVDLNNLSNPTIDVALNTKSLMALNTTFKDNHLYFGTAFATGDFSFVGPIDNMNININASTQAGTVFNIPLNTSTTVSDYDFINFVSHKDTAVTKIDHTKAFNGVTLNLNLNVDEKSTVKITTDYGVIQGNGQSRNLSLRINSLGDFDMFGEYTITTGKFDFTAKNFISKNFTINQGGTIRWTGNPSNAQINLSAIYEVRTDTKPLYDAAGFPSPKGSTTELVQAELLITNSLIQPDISFDFNFPTDPSIKDDLATYLSDNNNRNRQALSVIVTRSFASGAGSNNLTNQVLGTAQNAAYEFAFNKLSNLIAQSNAVKNLDLTIRSFNDVSASLKLAHERIILDGSLFNTTGSNSLSINSTLLNSNFNTLTKDFQASYLIRKDGSLSGRYSYRVLNSNLNVIDLNTVEYVNGVGLVYQHDFDTFGEFLKYIFTRRGSGSKKSTPAAAIPTVTPISNGSNTPPPPPTTVQPAKKDEEEEN